MRNWLTILLGAACIFVVSLGLITLARQVALSSREIAARVSSAHARGVAEGRRLERAARIKVLEAELHRLREEGEHDVKEAVESDQ